MIPLKKKIYNQPSKSNNSFILVGNIGGTNVRLALIELKSNSFDLILLLESNSQKVTNFTELVKHVLHEIKKDYNITIKHAYFAVAGNVSDQRDTCFLPNLPWDIKTKPIIKQTSLETATLLNDFEAISYGIQILSAQDIEEIWPGEKPSGHKTKAIIGAGTGLGKSMLAWNTTTKQYFAVPTEGGHADFPIHTIEELALCHFIKTKKEHVDVIIWEDLLAGRGIQNIYNFLNQQKNIPSSQFKTIEQSNFDSKVILQNKHTDACCKKTFEMFSKFYGRCAKNTALNTLPWGGIYIAGGIAQGNLDIFKNDFFFSEFFNNQRFSELLKKIPIYVIINEHIELYGTVVFKQKQQALLSSNFNQNRNKETLSIQF